MVLTCDIGNSNVHLGIFRKDRLVMCRKIPVDRFRPDRFPRHAIMGAIVSSVVPRMTPRVSRTLRTCYGVRALVLGPGTATGLRLLYKDRAQLGADRIANAVGAWKKYGRDALIISFGTATTYDVVTHDGVFLGGAIAPGVETGLSALAERTALLPSIRFEPADQALGRTTRECLRAGAFFAVRGAVLETVRQIEREFGANLFVVATGGLAHRVAPHVALIEEVDPDLTLLGLYEIYKLNR